MDTKLDDQTVVAQGMEALAGVPLPKFAELELSEKLKLITDMDKGVIEHFKPMFPRGVNARLGLDWAAAVIEWKMLDALPSMEALVGLRKALSESNVGVISEVKTVALEILRLNMQLMKSVQQIDDRASLEMLGEGQDCGEEYQDIEDICCNGIGRCFEGPFKAALKTYLDLKDDL